MSGFERGVRAEVFPRLSARLSRIAQQENLILNLNPTAGHCKAQVRKAVEKSLAFVS